MKLIDLKSDLTALNGISDKRKSLYNRLGVETVGDLLTFYPRKFIDLTSPVPVKEVVAGEYAAVKAVISKKLPPFFGRLSVYKIMLTEKETGDVIICTFFNDDYCYNRLVMNKEYIFYGKVNESAYSPHKEIINPIFIFPDSENKLLPRYRLTAGLTNAIVSANVKSALETADLSEFPDLPEELLKETALMPTSMAVKSAHFPLSKSDYDLAKRSLSFKELLVLQLGMSMIRSRNRKLTGAPMEKKSDFFKFYSGLPFAPTNAQVRAVNECAEDMKKLVPMNRLLQGDVGSGKTLVAAALAFHAFENGFQTALMVPTEILAAQHYEVLKKFLSPLGINCVLLTGSLSVSEKKKARAEIESGQVSVAVGTHALIQKDSEFKSLGLVITDEQHRFGVGQRSKLIAKGLNPHTLVISATPIPRTLGLIIYGDLDISVLDEAPKGRIPIKTYAVDSSFRERLYKFIIKRVEEGEQAYIVCPLIEEGASEKASAVKYYNNLVENWFKAIPTGLLHGKMKSSEKDEIMARFKDGEIKVLVATTVIEVGVDVASATVMLIENAEQFGLSQLHQLRGRVGRGEKQSYCALITDSDSPYTKARTETMTRTSNGFEIAGEDLKLRGPGDFFGSAQHGLPMLKIADMTEDLGLLEEAQNLAKRIIKDDPELTSPENARLLVLTKELFKGSAEYGYN